MSNSDEQQQVKSNQKAVEDRDQEEAGENKSNNSHYNELNDDELRSVINDRDTELDELYDQLDDANDKLLRKTAELENYRKRVQRERSNIYETAKANALKDFLSVNDDLIRTLEASRDLNVNQTFLEGVELVADKFHEILKQNKVQRIDEEGVEFNVDIHDALMRKKPDKKSTPSDIVLKIVESGYKIGDRTIRHAKVIVSE